MLMRVFCLTFQFFWLVLVIPGKLVLDDCIYASPERFLDFLWHNTNLPIGSLYKVPHLSPPFLFYDVIADKAHYITCASQVSVM